MSVSFRTEHTTVELHAFVDLEMAIWGAEARDAVPMTLLRALVNNGGVLVGAYAGSRPVGMALGFPARRGSCWLLWSHSSGVHPRYQRQGIGLALKQHQRQWALANGFDHMRWTFDPLQAGNAWFNLVLLGAHADTYHVDYYGEMTDRLNTGLPSDRVEAVWNLKRKNTKHPPAPSVNQQAAILSADSAGLPLAAPPANPDMQQHYVEIPAQISALDRQTAVLSWRLALRAVLQPALTSGSTLTGFQRDGGRCWYVLTTPAPWFLYVLECSDGSLYTGITTEVERRLAAHNAGRGAAYTAARRPVRCMGSWRFANHSDALRAEAAFKRQPRAAKLERLRQQAAFQGGIFVRGLYGAW